MSLSNPLKSLHDSIDTVEFQPYADVEIVSTFGEPQAEYSAIRKAAGLMDNPQRGVIEVTGKDRLSFLNNLLTQKLWDKQAKSGLEKGKGVYSFLLNNQGRIVADMNILELGERSLIEMDARLIDGIIKSLDKYIFTEQVKLTSKVGLLHQLSMHGPNAAELLALRNLNQGDVIETTIADVPVTIFRDDQCAVAGFHLIVPSGQVEKIWHHFVDPYKDQTNKRTLRPIGWAAYNSCRIEAGRPFYGVDFDDSILPAETGQMDRAVSLTKGCYLGQEVVARMHARNAFAKQLVGIKMQDDNLPLAGSPIYDDAHNTIGGITSSTISPVLSRTALCLGYVKKPFVAEGTQLNVPAEGAMRKGTVTKTPFI